MALDCDTGVIADALFEAGQPVEQGTLARIGSAYNCNTEISSPIYRYFTGRNVYFR